MVTAAAVRGGFALGRDRQVAAHVRLAASQGAEGKAPGGPAVAGDPRRGGPRRVAGPVRSSEPAHGRSQAYRGSFSVCPERLSAFPSTVAGRTCRLDRSAAYPRHIGQVPPQPIGFPRARRCVRRGGRVLRRTGSRMPRFRVHTHKTPPARLRCTSAPWANTRGMSRVPATPAAILPGWQRRRRSSGACPGGPGEVGAAVRLEAAHEPGAEAPARTGPHVPPLRSGQLRNAEARPAAGAVGRPGRARGRN
jgi:hypothetical protein